MTVHPRAADFTVLQEACDAVQTTKLASASDPMVLQTNESWYQQDRERLVGNLSKLEIQPLAVLRSEDWTQICQLYGLYDLQLSNGYIRVQMPTGWSEDKVVVSQAVGYEGAKARYRQFSSLALQQSATLEDGDLLRLLMPEQKSRNWGEESRSDDLTVTVELAPAPIREQVIMKRLQAVAAPFHVAADKSAIAFAPPLGEQLSGINERVQHHARRWEDYEPIIAVPDGSAVALVGQWGDYFFESLAIQAALQAS